MQGKRRVSSLHRDDRGRGLPPTPDFCRQFIEDQILSSEWPSGTKLPSERALAGTLGVSRPVIREVLKELQADGLVEAHPGRGSFVRDLAPTAGHASIDHLVRGGQITTRELVTARRMLEAEAAYLAAENRTLGDLEKMRHNLDQFEKAASVALAVEWDTAFHESIVEASRNPVIQIMFSSIRQLVQAMVLRSLTDRETRRLGAPIHRTILEAIESSDPEAARKEMMDHISLSFERYGSDLDRPIVDVLNQRARKGDEFAELARALSESIRNIA